MLEGVERDGGAGLRDERVMKDGLAEMAWQGG